MHPDLDPHTSGLARLLRALPDVAAPPAYREFERRARPPRGRGHAGGRRLAAAALGVIVAVAVLVRLSGAPPGQPPVARDAPVTRQAPGPYRDDGPLAPRAVAAERWLASLPSEPAVVHVGTRAAVLRLEDRIAQVDDLLSTARSDGDQPVRLRALQQERARLVGTLVQVRYAETLADALP